jgi:hypothetical protein
MQSTQVLPIETSTTWIGCATENAAVEVNKKHEHRHSKRRALVVVEVEERGREGIRKQRTTSQEAAERQALHNATQRYATVDVANIRQCSPPPHCCSHPPTTSHHPHHAARWSCSKPCIAGSGRGSGRCYGQLCGVLVVAAAGFHQNQPTKESQSNSAIVCRAMSMCIAWCACTT